MSAAAFLDAAWVVGAMSVAGVAHVLWLRSAASKGFSRPLDGGVSWRGTRILGNNKQVRGLMAMPVAAAACFVLLSWIHAPWPLSTGGYALLGLGCGLAFMLAELPNSFLKRCLGVDPGGVPRQPGVRAMCFVLDRCDSTLGVLAFLACTVALEPGMGLWALALGPLPHAAFSAWLHRAGEKARAL